jgi:lipoprotein signal peptidase
MSKTFIRNPIFLIPCSAILLDWITKLYFNLTLGTPRIARQPFEIFGFLDIIFYPAILLKIIRGQISNFKVFPHLVHKYIGLAERFMAVLAVFLLILSLWLLYKYIKRNLHWKYFYCVVAGASLANQIEAMIFGRIVDWLRIELSVHIQKSNISLSVYQETAILNLADLLLYTFIPLTILFYLGHIVLKRKVKNEKVT